MMRRNATGRFVASLVVGALAGAGLGLFIAPRSGRETRRVVRQQAGHYVSRLRDRFREKDASRVAPEDRADARVRVSG
jgi:gas vesicle protein